MRKSFVLAATFCLLLMAFSVSAATKYAGDWKLDLSKSEMGQRSRIESMTMNVTQTDTELTYKRTAKLAEGDGGQGGGRRRGLGGNAGSVTYDLTGKETSAEIGGGRFTGKATYKAETKDGKLVLTTTRTFETPNGTRNIKTVETWSLSEDGKTLTIASETNTPRGSRSSKMVFTKV